MKYLREAAAFATALALSGCAGASNVQSALAFCDSNPGNHIEVYVPQATVVRVLGTRDSRSGMHEGFVIRTPERTIRVEDNVDITGPIPMERGDAISLLGQLECDDYVMHWTHRDPRGRHPSGYIKVNGRTYD